MTANTANSFSRWLDSKPERWTLLNIVLLTMALFLLGPGSWVARALVYGAVLIVLAWRSSLVLMEAREQGNSILSAAMRSLSGFGLIGLCGATAVFAVEYSSGPMFALTCVLFGFQLYFFRLFSERDGGAHNN